MKSFKLVVDFDYSFTAIALRSSLKEYKLAYAINKILDISLEKQDDIIFELSKQSRFSVSNFLFESECATFRLLKNKAYDFSEGVKPYLLPEKKEFDYLLHVDGEDVSYEKQQLLDILKKLPEVEFTESLDVDHLKSKNNLLF
jgi:hypothetical protein